MIIYLCAHPKRHKKRWAKTWATRTEAGRWRIITTTPHSRLKLNLSDFLLFFDSVHRKIVAIIWSSQDQTYTAVVGLENGLFDSKNDTNFVAKIPTLARSNSSNDLCGIATSNRIFLSRDRKKFPEYFKCYVDRLIQYNAQSKNPPAHDDVAP